MRIKGNRILMVLLLLGAGVAVLLISTRTRSASNVSVRFSGYTNDASGGRVAAFELTNNGQQPVRRWVLYRCVTNSDPQHVPPFSSVRYISSIQAGRSERILIPPPVELPWRAMFTYSIDGWRPRLFVWLENHGRMHWAARTANSFPVEIVESGWIDK